MLVLAFKLLILLPLVPVFVAAFRHRPPPAAQPAAAGTAKTAKT